MNDVGFTLKDEKKLLRKLSRIEIKLQKKIRKDAMKDGADIVLHSAQSRSSGKIKQSLHIRTRTKKGVFEVSVQTRGRAFFGIAADDKFFYPALIEFGSPAHKIKNAYGFLDVNHPGHKPLPYLRPAIDNNKDQVIRTVMRSLARKITQAAKK